MTDLPAGPPESVYLDAARAALAAHDYPALYNPDALELMAAARARQIGHRATVDSAWHAALHTIAAEVDASVRAVASMRTTADLDARHAELAAQAPGNPT